MNGKVSLPKTAVVELTYRCNHRCLYCSCPWEADVEGFPTYEKGAELDLSQWKQALDILASAGIKNISVSGGEALLKPELPDILDYIRKKDFNKNKTIVVISNGLAMSEEFLAMFKHYNVHLSLSLPGLKTFERHTGRDNATGVLHWLHRAHAEGVRTTMNVTVTALNYDELYETIAYGFISGADTLLLNRFLIGGRGIRYQNELSLSREQVNGMLDTAENVLKKARRWGGVGTEMPLCLVDRDKSEYKNLQMGFLCAAAKNFFVVDPAGNIRACNHSPRIVGHIFNRELITDTKYWNMFANRDYIPQECSDCKDVAVCDCGCREVASITCGSCSGKDPCLIEN